MYIVHVRVNMLPIVTTSSTDARKRFFELLEMVTNDHHIVLVNRRNGENVALIAESDLSSLMETVYLLRSPENAKQLFAAIERSVARDEQSLDHKTTQQAIADLKKEVGIDEEI